MIVRNNGDVADYTDENGRQLVIYTTCVDSLRKIVQVREFETNKSYVCGACKNHKYRRIK